MGMDARPGHPMLPGAGGFLLPFRAIGLIVAHPALLRWSLLAGLVSAVLLSVLLGLLVAFTGDLLGLLWAKPTGWLVGVWYVAAALVFGLLFVLGASTVPTVATAPFLDPLSADTERVLGAAPEDIGGLARVVAETANAIGKAILRIALLLAGHAVLLLLWLLPGIGQGLWSAAALAWTVFWLAFEYLDVPANRHGFRFRDTLALVRANAPAAIGLGLGVYLILWVPLLNVFFVPVGAVAATALFVELSAGARVGNGRSGPR